MQEIRITLETLYDILRNEKKREDLQKLEDTFFIDVVTYLREKRALLEQKKVHQDLFAGGEKDKLEYELRSIKRILKEIYEKREKKIIDIAINKSKTRSDIIDTSALLREEKEFYTQVLEIFDVYRRGVLGQLFKGDLPLLSKVIQHQQQTPFQQFEETEDETGEPEVMPSTSEEMTRIRFIHPTPSFVWKDMKEYGPFDPGEELVIYPEVADLLVRKGRAVKV